MRVFQSNQFLTVFVGNDPVEMLKMSEKSKIKKDSYVFWYKTAKEWGEKMTVKAGWYR